ncbi:membrane protein [Thermodesulfomicrobium sp. WS]|uniref:DUF554 domain-containing protein n=1 Tax=Thermodesulfomicrobium sp. WS TaxID=3004129 RepID=UPI00249306B3|nr:DUF554 domain-containing protein [Thermodesulfomicrobium sp. WS]BDV00358.1 membrane protein [Thermodesulfomicrobium sp. WS]
MHFPSGVALNAGAIVLGSLVGLLLHGKLPERIRTVVFQGLGLCVLIIGIQMALQAQNGLFVALSVLVGGIAGELLRLEECLESLGNVVKRLVRSSNAQFTDGLVSASLLFCVGAMAIVGSLDEGLRGDGTVLATKSLLDGFSSIALASTYGLGVAFSALPVLLYQGGIALAASAVQDLVSPLLMAQITGTGGVLIAGIGLSLLGVVRVRLASLLPALVVIVPITVWGG